MVKFILKETLEKKDITRYKLSKLTGIDYNTLSKMFNNQATQIKLDTLNKLCNALDCEITDILELS
ncbi:helix-turn-helix transcriptional regulator [Clostridium botulinum C]|uniref:Helix-turn-helix transcriptional regulator n=2 Tax=Clostridium botulinum TaxID=1491 RepID=A0A9Q3VAK3_CLOBO|nr:helix-turn-helix transcriptional regulator [Clostridium botulinum]EGO88322.1 hypothetical protein CBCST_06158 [Clostridium botulinum C str. Stockholm]MCD3196156.1 helix-turn-helix transcriptional regulator [Clostridium botulinum C]MCD3201499.1 helix-turn-helix transcriptional regulator [Clostridium botulinum C]MCD3207058.1 helix-turn-helix transcriptional regulator [Clostridium botulinum C]MCD3209632.1 helix-turn-helix transcriptional regulator [Clostridium botulinum C]